MCDLWWTNWHWDRFFLQYFVLSGWAGHVARIGGRRGTYRVLVGKPERKNQLEDLVIDGRTIIK